MRLLILVCLLILSFNLYGQHKKRSQTNYYLKFQGGLLYDAHLRAYYLGFNILNAGWAKFKDNKHTEINLELIGYTTDFQAGSGPNSTPPKWRRKRRSAEAEYYRSLLFRGDLKSGFSVGPAASLRYMYNKFDPSSSGRVRYEEKAYNHNLGMKVVYFYGLGKKMLLCLSTKVHMLDLGIMKTRSFSPFLPLSQQTNTSFDINLIRNQFAILAGISFKL